MKTCPRCGNTHIGKTKTGYACHGCYSWFDVKHRGKWMIWLLVALSFLLLPFLGFGQSPAKLNVERRGQEVILYVTGGTSNVQYQVWTAPNPDHNVASTNWYYWRRVYSRDYLANPGYGEVLVYGENTSKQPQRFFQIRGVLPD